jgi:hypothetical protein
VVRADRDEMRWEYSMVYLISRDGDDVGMEGAVKRIT